MEKIHLALSAMFGDRYVTNNGRVNTLTMVTKITLGQEGTNEIMEKMHLASVAAIGGRPVTNDCNFDNIDNVNKYNKSGQMRSWNRFILPRLQRSATDL